jgi:hypothetical protein
LGSITYAFDEAYIDKVYLEADPTSPLMAATKQYVDAQISGIDEHNELGNLNWAAAGHTIDANITPTASGTVDLGTITLAYDEAYIDYVYGQSARFNQSSYYAEFINGAGGYFEDGTHTVAVANAAYAINAVGGNSKFENGSLSVELADGTYAIDSIGDIRSAGSIIPEASGTRNIGTVSYAFDNAYIDKLYLEDDPTLPLQAATKQYVDAQISGENFWQRAATEVSTEHAGDSIVPNASGTQAVGSVAKAWQYGYFDNLEAGTSMYAATYYGDGSNLTGISTTTDFISLTDTPADYTGMAASGVRVNATADGLEFYHTTDADIDTLQSVTDRGATTTQSITTGGISADGASVFNESGADVDFRVEGSTDANLITADAGLDQVAIGQATPTSKLDVAGDIETGSTDAMYWGDPTTDGSWRMKIDSGNFVVQKRESGAWVTKGEFLA